MRRKLLRVIISGGGVMLMGLMAPQPLAFAGRPDTEATTAQAPSSTETDDAHLNIVDQKLALCLAVDLAAQIQMTEKILSEVKQDSIRQAISAHLDRQRGLAARIDAMTGGRTKAAIERALREIAAHTPPPSGLAAIRQDATATVVRIRLEIAQENGRLLQEQIRALDDEFDRAYLRAEIVGQTQYLATLLVFSRQASPDLAEVLSEATQQTNLHMTTARSLLGERQLTQLATPAVK